MISALAVEAAKMPSVQGHDGATGCSGIMEDRGVGVALVALSVLHDGQNIVPKCAESLDDRQRYVFVRVESGHGLGSLMGWSAPLHSSRPRRPE